jgi:hypothetical protein
MVGVSAIEGTLVPFEDTLRPTRPVRFFSPLSLEKNAPACSAFSEFLVEAGSL